MDPILLDKNLAAVGIIDTFDSFIWTDKYNDYGDFEIILPISAQILSFIQLDYYLTIKESEHIMIIEKLVLISDPVNGNKVKISGRSLESILMRRIIWTQTMVIGKLEGAVNLLVGNNAAGPLVPAFPARKISRLSLTTSLDPNLDLVEVENKQYLWENLFDVVKTICNTASVGFKITLDPDNYFIFQLYLGLDRSYNQAEPAVNPYVAFTPKFNNLVQGTYTETSEALKTLILVSGDGEGIKKITAEASINGGGSDLDRREMYAAGGISQNTTVNGVASKMKDEQYIAQLKEKGLEILSNNTLVKTFEGQLDTTRMYTYGQDFFLGDIVQVANEYGHEAASRVTEVIYSEDSTGIRIYPTFGIV